MARGTKQVTYRALARLRFGGTTVEPGEVTSIPGESVRWLLDQGYIEPTDSTPPRHEEVPTGDEGSEPNEEGGE